MYIFLSHASKEHVPAEELCNLLEAKGHQCFLAPRDIRTGHEYAEEIMEGIERADVMVLLLSEASNESPHVLREIERAVSKKINIVVYQLEKVELSKSMEYFLMSHQWVNTGVDTGYDEIVKSIEALQAGEQQPKDTVEELPEKERTGFLVILKKYRRLVIALIIIIFVILIGKDVAGADRQKNGNNTADSENEENVSENQPQPTEILRVELGDTLMFGTYNGEPIEWRVLKLNEDGTAVVVSSHILTMKAFDAAESGKYNTTDGKSYWWDNVKELDSELQQKVRGSSRWSTSNIRTWLNSEKENVSYADQAPTAKAMSELVNGYAAEPGFLSGFSDKEREAIVATQIVTNGETSEDKVFLLSEEELSWFETADVNRLAVPTAQAVTQDKTGWYQWFAVDYGVEDYYWWLRDAAAGEEGFSAHEVYVVANSYAGGQLISKSAGLEGFGIRPAMTLDLMAEGIVIKDEE